MAGPENRCHAMLLKWAERGYVPTGMAAFSSLNDFTRESNHVPRTSSRNSQPSHYQKHTFMTGASHART